MTSDREKSNASRLPRWVVFVFTAFSLCFLSEGVSGRQLKFHGPIIQWNEDPATTASFSWIEIIAPEAVPNPVWRTGASGFGYGDDDDSTVLGDMKALYPRVYLAKSFEVSSVPKDGTIQLGIRYDDAFVAYINGHELVRSRNITGRNTQARVTKNHEAKGEEIFTIPNAGNLLKRGRNMISIEGHNARLRSSDFTLEPRLFLNGKKLIGAGEDWLYLAGGAPDDGWVREMPVPSLIPDLPMDKESEWELLIRLRGSGGAYASIKPKKIPFGSSGNSVFQAKATGLRPDTEYEYSLAAGNNRVKRGWFRTAPAVLTRPMRFVVGGDMGTSGAVPMCKAVGEDDPLFAVVGGDLAYANGRAFSLWYEWLDNWTDLVVAPDGRSIPIIAAIGNHEMRSFSGLKKSELWKGLAYLRTKKTRAPLYFSLFDLPGGNANFTVDFGNYMSLVVLDSGYATKEKNQAGWLEKQLGERVRIPNLFTIYHKPAWGVGIKENNRNIQEYWCPLFEKYQIDCAFENDHHCYKRSFPITAGHPDKDKGILYLGDGAWGAVLRPITERMLDRSGARRYLAKWRSIHHVTRVTLRPGGRRKYEAFDSDRNVFDSYADSKPRRNGIPEKKGILPALKSR